VTTAAAIVLVSTTKLLSTSAKAFPKALLLRVLVRSVANSEGLFELVEASEALATNETSQTTARSPRLPCEVVIAKSFTVVPVSSTMISRMA
jgi:hypothetical protein